MNTLTGRLNALTDLFPRDLVEIIKDYTLTYIQGRFLVKIYELAKRAQSGITYDGVALVVKSPLWDRGLWVDVKKDLENMFPQYDIHTFKNPKKSKQVLIEQKTSTYTAIAITKKNIDPDPKHSTTIYLFAGDKSIQLHHSRDAGCRGQTYTGDVMELTSDEIKEVIDLTSRPMTLKMHLYLCESNKDYRRAYHQNRYA